MILKDQIGQELHLSYGPKRIVSLVPSLTELLFDLDLEDRIVGLTKFCVHPNHARNSKKVVGGTKNVKLDKIRALKPDFILCNKEENSQEIVASCKEIAPTYVSDIESIADVYEFIEQCGVLFERAQKTAQMIRYLESEIESYNKYIQDQKKYKVAYFIWKDPWMIAANKTFIHTMLELGGFVNVFDHLERYPEIDWKELPQREVELVLLSSEPFPFQEKHQKFISERVPNVKTIIVDGEMFSWYGSRLTKAFRYLKRLHQSITALSI